MSGCPRLTELVVDGCASLGQKAVGDKARCRHARAGPCLKGYGPQLACKRI